MEHHLVTLVVSFRRRLSFERLAQHKLEHLAKYGRLKVFRAHLSLKWKCLKIWIVLCFIRKQIFFLPFRKWPPPHHYPYLRHLCFCFLSIFLRVSPHFLFSIREEKDVKRSSKICTYQPLEIYVYFIVASLFIENSLPLRGYQPFDGKKGEEKQVERVKRK